MDLAILIFASNNSLATKKKKDTQHKIGFQLKSNLEFNWIWTLQFLHTHTHTHIYIGKTERKSNKILN